ncbi:hypothetical protein D3C80_869710 [compost metagenome]
MAALGKDATDRRPAQGGHAPHAGHQGHGPRPQAFVEHQADQRVAQGKQDAAAQALDAAADQQHRHAGRCGADHRAQGEHCQGQEKGCPRAQAFDQLRRQGRTDDRGGDEQGGAPGIKGQAADVGNHGRQNGGHYIDVDRMQGHTSGQGNRAQGVAPAQQFSP